jgi:predicted DNA-binding ribbon-helix-helix protein
MAIEKMTDTNTNRIRGELGQFVQKSNQPRLVRSIRLTDLTWEAIGNAAGAQNITRADLLEQLAEQGVFSTGKSNKLSRSKIKTIDKSDLEAIIATILEDPSLTRNGKDKGAARRVLQGLLSRLP